MRKKMRRVAELSFMKRLLRRRMEAEGRVRLPHPLPREERRVIVVDVRKARTAELADQFIQVKPNSDYEVLQALRALIRDEMLDVDEVGGSRLRSWPT